MLSLGLLWSLFALRFAYAEVTVYGQTPLAMTQTPTALGAAYTGLPAYDPSTLNPPPIPNPLPPMAFPISLQTSSSAASNLSMLLKGNFLGFSVEFSVADQILGSNASLIQVPFLNLMASLRERGGGSRIRVGGNTQEFATLVDSLPDGQMMYKNNNATFNPTHSPELSYTSEVLYLMSNISSLVGTDWYLGIPLNDTNFRLGIAEQAPGILGDHLLGFQVGNEPDLYAAHGHRPGNYSQYDYFGEFGSLVAALENDPKYHHNGNMKLIGPNVATGDWTPEMVWDTGFIGNYTNNLAALAVEHYPTDNCGFGAPIVGQDIIGNFLTHSTIVALVQPYVNSAAIAQVANQPFVMFETNTASCGGFVGISDSFTSALWGLDYGLQMAYQNFSAAMFHVSGQSVYYNPFTPPPTNESSFHQWSVNPLFYANLIMAEMLGTSGTAQVVDVRANSEADQTPAYAVYESGSLTKLGLFNTITDPSGNSTYTTTIQFEGGSAPGQVYVKRLSANSVATKTNISWAGQTYGGNFESDGRLQGSLDIETVTCTNGACPITVPAPGFALVHFSDSVVFGGPSTPSASLSMTFATTVYTKTVKTVTVNPSVLATSNGHMAMSQRLGSTSNEKSWGSRLAPSLGVLSAVAVGVSLVTGVIAQ